MRIHRQLNLSSVSTVSLLLITWCLCGAPLPAAEVNGLVQGGLERQVYTNIQGNTVYALTNSPKFPDSPDLVTVVSSFEAPSNVGDNYGQRLSGYLLPPVTGDYVFYIASDDQSVLFLSTDYDYAHKRVIAYESAWRPPRMWLEPGPNGGTHISAPIRLESGRSYYVEALHEEGGGGDNLAVTWQLPGSLPPPNGSDPIAGQYLAHGGVPTPDLSFQLAFFTCLDPCTGGNLYFRNYTVTGPQEPGPLLPSLRVLPDASQRYFYANRWQSVLKIDSQLGTAVEMQLPPSVPELSWPMGMAYDSTRDRELLASLGGEGFLYAYSPGQDLWSLVASMHDRDVDSIVYHAPQDSIYAFEVHRGTGPGRLFKFNASGIYQREFQLPPIPVDVGVYPYQSEMVSVGDYLVLLIGPELNRTPPAPQHEFIYVIDPRTGESWLTYHHLLQPNTPPTVTCGASRTVTTYSTNGVFTSVNASVRDAEGDAITIVWLVDGIAKATNNLPQGPTVDRSISYEDWFGIGTHEIAIFAMDGRGQPQSCGLVLTVVYSPQQTLVVTSNGDSGPGTLRDIIAGAPAGATITFGITGTITLSSGELVINKPLNIQGPGAQVLAIQRADSTIAFRLFNIQGRGVSISDLTVRNGLISTLCQYDDGAGILNRGALILNRCVLSGHEAMGEYSRGGALCNQWGAGLIVVGCTFAGNQASGGYGEGGAIYNYGRLAVTNSTFSGNSAGGWGGAIHNDMMSQGTLIDSCTFTGNTAEAGGGIFNRGAPPQHVSPVFVRDTIIVGNTPDDVSHCSLILSGGYNLVGEVTDPYGSMGLPIVPGPGDRFNVTPDQVRLGPLQLNDGPTPTHALLQHSIAIDAGPDSGCPATDQRGVVRPFGPRCDIGAFESDVVFPDTAPEIVCPSPATWQATSSDGATGTVTVQVKNTDGDPLVVIWVIDGNPWQTNSLPDGAITPVSVSLTLTLPPGTHPIAVSVFDGTPPVAACLTSVEVLPAPGSWVTRTIFGDWVSLSANPSPDTSVWAVEEQPPTNWMVINVTDGGVFDLVTHKVKFGPFFDSEPRTLGYKALPPLGFVGIGLVSGLASADGKSTPVTGDDRIVVAVPHPADLNPADWALRMDELTAYAAAWRTGGVWVLPPNPIPMDYVTKAASLWLGGEVYTIDASKDGPPMWWVSPPVLKPMGLEDAIPGSGIRRLSAVYVPGQALDVALQVVPSSGGRAFAVDESVPAGWRVESISHGGQFDSVNRQAKWGPFFDSVTRTLRYQFIPPADAHGCVTLAGRASFDGVSTPVDGPAQLNSGSSLKWSAHSSNGGWTLRLQGELGTCYEVESSTDLVNWTSVATLTNTLGSIEVPVTVVPQTPHLYFRARAIP